MAARIIWGTGIAAALCYIVLAVVSKLSLEPGGLLIFDSRLGGYTGTVAREYLIALAKLPGAVALYLGPFRWLDTAFPALMSFTLGGVIWLNTRGLHPVVRLLLLTLPATYLIMDYAENALVAQMLRAGVQVSESTIDQASDFTVAKWISLGVAVAVSLWAWRFAPKARNRRP